MKKKLSEIIVELITINEDNPQEELYNIIDELERFAMDLE